MNKVYCFFDFEIGFCKWFLCNVGGSECRVVRDLGMRGVVIDGVKCWLFKILRSRFFLFYCLLLYFCLVVDRFLGCFVLFFRSVIEGIRLCN